MLLVYTPKITSRILYIFRHIFMVMLDLEIKVTSSIEEFVAHNGPKFSYSSRSLGNELFFYSSSLLIDQGIQDISINVLETEKYPFFFKVNGKSAMTFDVFAASFYLITRYEEYLPHLKDDLGRFQYQESLAFKNDFLDKPIVDIWIVELIKILNKKFGIKIQIKNNKKKIIPILEVAEAFEFSHKSIFSSFLQAVISIWKLNLKKFIIQIKVLLRISDDPYLNYDCIIDQFKKLKIDFLSFFRFTQHSLDIYSVSIFNSSHRLLIKSISDKTPLGLLVSFYAQNNINILKDEMNNLTKLIHRNSQKIRLNLGILSISEIYPMLIQNQILEDYSMGYVDKVGFRASTSIPFYYYDLVNEVQSPLKIYPIVITQFALKSLSIENTFKKIKSLYLALPLKNSNFCFVVTPKIFSESKEYSKLLSSFIKFTDET